METGIVFNIQKFCIHDGDGIRTCVFLKGCPLRCVWCHNPESLEKSPILSFNNQKCSLCGKCVDVCLNDANEIIGKEMTTAEVFDTVMKDKMFYDTSGGGITITGGEPSYQADFTLELLTLCKNAGISLAIETCGIGTREFYKECTDLGVTFLYDIKCIESARHKALTGADNRHILENLKYLMGRNADIILRLPMIPECNDSDEDIKLLSEFLNENKGRYRYAEVMPYHTLGKGKAEKIGTDISYIHDNASEEEISRWCALFNSHGISVRVSK